MNSIMAGEDITNAMDLRCFGQGPRTWLYKLHYQKQDWFLIGLSAAMLLVGFVSRYAFHTGGFWVPEFWLKLAGA